MIRIGLILILCFLWVEGFSQRSTANDVAGYWRFEETSGTTANDETGNHNGTTNATINQTGKVNQCYDYNGTSDATDVTDHADFEGDALSISMWVNLDDSDSPVLIAKRDNSNYSWEIAIGSDIGGNKVLYRINGNTNLAISTNAISESTWTHVCGTYDKDAGGTEEIKIYLNGEEEGTGNYSVTISANAVDVSIGARSNFSGAEEWTNGKIDELVIYPRALTSIEVKNHYGGGNGLLYITENFKNEKINISEYLAYLAEYRTCTN